MLHFEIYQNEAFNVYSLFKIFNLNRQFFNQKITFNRLSICCICIHTPKTTSIHIPNTLYTYTKYN
jgi:hypothetical protein